MFPKTGSKWIISVTLLLVCVMGMASCTAPVEPPAVETSPAQPEASLPAASVPPVEAATAVPDEEETSIVILIPEDPPNFNAAIGDTGYDSLVMKMVLMGLADIDPDGRVFPRLAAELPTLENGGVVVDEEAGTMVATWKLRQGVTWADGTPVTSDDVIFTYEEIIDPETGTWIQGIDYVDGIEKIDDSTFAIKFNTIYPGYLTLFGGEQVVIWPKHYCDAEQGFTAWDCARQPLSSGPYMLEEWVTGDHMTFVRNPNYYEKDKPQIDQIIVQIVPDAAVRRTMMVEGDADVYMWATEQIADELKDEPNVKVSVSPTSRWVMRLFMNLAAKGSIDPAADPHPILADVRVRQAIRQAIDVDTISKEIFRGYSVPVWSELFRNPYTCEIPKPVYDPDAAIALLEEAGWKDTDGDGVRECHGCLHAAEGDKMEMELITYPEYGEPIILTQQLIGEMLGKVGMKLELSTVQGSVLWADYESGGIEQRGDFSIDLYDDGYGGIDPTDFLWQYYYSTSAEPGQGWNVGRWKNTEFDALLDQAYTLDEVTRKDLFCQIADLLDKELPQILMFSTINADAYSKRLNGLQSNINDVVTWNVANWTLAE